MNTNTFMNLVILTTTMMGSWTWNLGKKLLEKIQSNLPEARSLDRWGTKAKETTKTGR